MPENNPQAQEPDPPPLLNLIQKIKEGQVDPVTLNHETKVQCTELFRLEGQTIYQIAQILKMSDRQIKRYNKEIKRRNTIVPGTNFLNQYLGNTLQKRDYQVDGLIRLSSGKEANTAEKIKAKSAALHHMNESVKLLQSLGHAVSQDQPNTQHKAPFSGINILPVPAKGKDVQTT